MKNALNYYYNLNPTEIHQINKNYRCYVAGNEYYLALYDRSDVELQEIYELSTTLIAQKIPCHQIIINKQNRIITQINGSSYVLLKLNIESRTININDILLFSKLRIESSKFKLLNKSNWYQLWTQKVDYFEYQVSQLGKKYPLIKESSNYYIGLSENAISLLENVTSSPSNYLIVSHRRIEKNQTTLEFYNPLNFIIDCKIRDFSEYVKEMIFSNKCLINQLNYELYQLQVSNYDHILFLSRLLFPTYYFDCCEKIIFETFDEKEIVKVINQNNKYLDIVKMIYLFLQQNGLSVEIEWIKK